MSMAADQRNAMRGRVECRVRQRSESAGLRGLAEFETASTPDEASDNAGLAGFDDCDVRAQRS